jgi:hypothetical protein
MIRTSRTLNWSPSPIREQVQVARMRSTARYEWPQHRTRLKIVGAQTFQPFFQPAPSKPDQAPRNPPYPGESHITFQWNNSRPGGAPRAFTSPAGAASSVTALDIYLGTILTGTGRTTIALFYHFATRIYSARHGFSVGNGAAILSC